MVPVAPPVDVETAGVDVETAGVEVAVEGAAEEAAVLAPPLEELDEQAARASAVAVATATNVKFRRVRLPGDMSVLPLHGLR